MADTIRAFIAIELNRETKAQLGAIREKLKKSSADVQWVKPDCVHLTLKFLGNIAQSQLSPIKEILQEIAGKTAIFQAALSKIGAFPKMDYPRVIWVGVEEKQNRIFEINRKLEEKLEKIGFARESRPYQPHLTLGRVKSSKNKEELKKSVAAFNSSLTTTAKMAVSNIKLFKSTLTPKGPIHTCLLTINLSDSCSSRDRQRRRRG